MVLIVDDDRELVVDLATALEAEGFAVRTAANGAEALASIESEPPRLVVLDVTLQDIDGVHVGRWLRKRWPSVRILMLSGTREPELRATFDDYDAYCLKGGPADDFVATVRRLAS